MGRPEDSWGLPADEMGREVKEPNPWATALEVVATFAIVVGAYVLLAISQGVT